MMMMKMKKTMFVFNILHVTKKYKKEKRITQMVTVMGFMKIGA